MKKYGILMGLITLLAGCAPQDDGSPSLPTVIKDNIYNTADHVNKWINTPPERPQPHDVADAYCYHVLQDILCYHQPIPGWEYRLAGYQGTYAEPPAPATMQLLAKRKANDSDLPATRAAAAKPVFTAVPVLPKETEKSSDQSQVVDSNHELLPDPALAPQL